jgi:hypothetical protein
MAALDAFGRLRTSDCFTTFNYYPSPLSNNTNLDVDVWVTSGNGGTLTYNTQNYINMPISGGSETKYSLRTTKQPMIYQSGKSRLIYMTGVLMTTISANTTSLMGLFDVNDVYSTTLPVVTEGTYFKCNVLNFYWDDVTQSGTNSVEQSFWNIDTFNGSGPSGKTLTVNNNANKNLLIVIDQEWLGVGRVRCGFIIDGVIYYAHQFLHNGLAIQYTKTPRLHLSYLISGATTANTMRQMCSTSISEGGYFSTGRINNISNPVGILVPLDTVENRVLLGLRVNSSYPNATFYIKKLNFFYTGSSGKIGQYKVQLFSTASNINIGSLSGGTPSWLQFFSPPPSYSALEYFFGNGSIVVSSPGFIIDSGYLETQTSTLIASDVVDSLQTRNLFSSYDILIITGISNVTNTGMGVSVTFVEDI